MSSDEKQSANKWDRLSSINILKPIGCMVAALLIFSFGVGVGSGNLILSGTNKKQAGLPADLNYATVEQVYDSLKSNYDGKLDGDKLLDGIKSGLVQATGDPHTSYYNADEAKDFEAQLNGSFTGIGAELSQDANKNLIVIAPITGFPAEQAGLRAKDIIVSVDNTSTSGMTVQDAVMRIRGKKDTNVTLKVIRNKSEDLTFVITRKDIKIPSVKWEVLEGNIGYLKINQYGDDTADLARQAADDLKGKEVKGIILDLRDNPGGLLTGAVDVSSLWLQKDKKVLVEKQGDVVTEIYHATGDNPLLGIPTVVLSNAGSASAAEITMGALRDNNVATLYGEKSYGKGSVQKVLQLANGSELKVTVARWYRPNGQNIDKKGIDPDKAITMSDADYKNRADPQKDAAIEFLKK